ncbi:TonB-dependent receptor [Mangrovivirga sp. M17]|uniref:TonB-dependent receptor n=1 Tax=Mangrovivirga halotolerans TaxID=2993936 RepID=A0ABT3RWL6_9BACT|nr:TonB-dependent receptor [Mangrovivirga halotolerans]MCX2745962.1 TonB-dependent receptor [Mangrovivirga halotolerans]
MNYSKVLFFLLFVTGAFAAHAQNGSMSGMITDGETGEELIGATVYIPSISKGMVTDIYGNYSIKNIPAGTYNVEISYVSYQKKTIEGVEIKDGQNTEISVALASDVQQMEEVVVVAKQIKNNEAALLSMQRKAVGVQDGISSQEIKNLGASNAAESMKQVTGASIEDGKYVVMRGLGDRYSISLLNGIPMPSADPYRNSTSMDMIPSDMVMNIVTQKTFTPDLPGNFTGGAVNISTKSMPEEFYLNVGLSMGYNTQSSFNDSFISDGNKGSTDWLGFDDGTRDRPDVVVDNNYELRDAINLSIQGRNPENESQRNLIDQSAKSLGGNFLPTTGSSSLNHGLNVSFGDQLGLGEKKLGYNIGLFYDRSFDYVGSGQAGYYNTVDAEVGPIEEQNYVTRTGTDKASVGALAGLSYQFNPTNEINLDVIYNHVGESSATINDGTWSSVTKPYFTSTLTSFKERTLSNVQLRGKHYFNEFKELKIDWSVGRINVKQDLPDMKIFAYAKDIVDGEDVYFMGASEIGYLPSHIFRYLDDVQNTAKLDIELKPFAGFNHKFKVGGWYSKKDRVFEDYFYEQVNPTPNQLNPSYLTFNGASGDLEAFFDNSNYGVVDSPSSNGTSSYGFGNYFRNRSFIPNFYTGEETIISGYAMADIEVSKNFQFVGGIRVESTDINTVSRDESAGRGVVNQINFLPSVNTKYKLSENANLRFAYGKTLARPNLREISPVYSIGIIGRPNYQGNINLQATKIHNFDLRYELFPKAGEMFAVSAYYKNFNNPIVLQLSPNSGSPEIKPINLDNATVYGAEIEFRKRLDFLGEKFENFKFGANFSYIYSRINKSQEEIDAYQEQELDFEDWRPLQGQSPYIINLSLNHYSPKLDWDNTLSFNIWGERLAYITGPLDPDVYEQSRPSLNFVSRKSINEHWSVSFKAMNILNMNYEKKFKDTDFIYESYQVGTDINLGVSYSF